MIGMTRYQPETTRLSDRSAKRDVIEASSLGLGQSCPFCGALLVSDATRCPQCGRVVVKDSVFD